MKQNVIATAAQLDAVRMTDGFQYAVLQTPPQLPPPVTATTSVTTTVPVTTTAFVPVTPVTPILIPTPTTPPIIPTSTPIPTATPNAPCPNPDGNGVCSNGTFYCNNSIAVNACFQPWPGFQGAGSGTHSSQSDSTLCTCTRSTIDISGMSTIKFVGGNPAIPIGQYPGSSGSANGALYSACPHISTFLSSYSCIENLCNDFNISTCGCTPRLNQNGQAMTGSACWAAP